MKENEPRICSPNDLRRNYDRSVCGSDGNLPVLGQGTRMDPLCTNRISTANSVDSPILVGKDQ